MTYDSIVIGAGPAGITAAVHMKRSGLKVALFEKGRIGGLLRNANRVENYLGFPDGISGKELIAYFEDHLIKNQVPLIREEIVEIGGEEDAYVVKTAAASYTGATVVIATGTVAKQAGFPGEKELVGTTLFYEVADVPEEARHAIIVVVGGGDAAFDYALHLHRQGHFPTLVTRSEACCLPMLRVRAEEKGIPFLEHLDVLGVRGKGDGIEVQCANQTLQAHYVLIAVGREPYYPRITAYNRSGIHFAGDVHGSRFRQVHIAAGDALRIAMDITFSLLTPHAERHQRIR
ncbi:hypothetical protein COU76_04620 [Candidatus Peregrinibacteria bacterium CG10_big_fil_rev_8_21_14_0_10_49_10]|nr:MAG: hypothetical protein COU76_04620 [Candidatus Peregrinibacteria bacterium CG10_big_fil_rev_8_21_14_0_10_49_10]